MVKGFLTSVSCLLVAVAAPAMAANPIEVRIDSYHFDPAPLHLKAGETVTISFINVSGATHDFKAPEFFRDADAERAVPKGVVVLKGGETVSVTVTPRKGSYKVKCSRFGHAMMGMTADIIVD